MTDETPKAVDVSTVLTKADATCLYSHGVRAVGRYYRHDPDDPMTPLTRVEAVNLSTVGLSLWSVFEYENTASYFTQGQGVTDARVSAEYADRTIQQPHGSAIYFAVDFDATEADITGGIADYFRGVASAMAGRYQIGVYGSGACCSYLLDQQLVAKAWLSQSTGYSGHSAFFASGRWAIAQLPRTTVCGIDLDGDLVSDTHDPGMFRVS